MTEPRKPTEPAGASGPDLLAVVTSVPGVHAIEPGLGTSLRTLDARLRRREDRTAHFGLHIDTAEGTAVVEVALDRSRPVRETVRDIQLALRGALAKQAGWAPEAESGDSPGTTPASPEVSVRVQSLHR